MNLHSLSVGWSLYDGDIDQQWIEDEQILFKVINKEPEWYSWDYSAIFSFDLLIHKIHIKFEYCFMGGGKEGYATCYWPKARGKFTINMSGVGSLQDLRWRALQ